MRLSELPLVSYREVISALQRIGFVVVRQRGSHIRMVKRTRMRSINITIPAQNPIKRTILRCILRDADLTPGQFKKLL